MGTIHPTRRAAVGLGAAALVAALASCRNGEDAEPGEEPTGEPDEERTDRTDQGDDIATPVARKPVLYLYPERETTLEVGLEYAGELTYAYPLPEARGARVVWRVTADTDSTLTDASGRTYPYLFWEGRNPERLAQTEGFVVRAEEVTAFLEDKLAILGLTDREAAEFITFWGPQITTGQTALLSFAGAEQAQLADYTFTEDGRALAPDVFLRVYLVIGDVPERPVPEQILTPAPARTGLTVVEWGGCDQRSTRT